MLQSVQLRSVVGMKWLTLKAPRLKKIKLVHCSFRFLDIVHSESVETFIGNLQSIPLYKLKNLKYLYSEADFEIQPGLLSDLKQLKEIHLNHLDSVSEFFDQKQEYGPADLKIYLHGLLLEGLDDSAIDSDDFEDEFLVHLAKHPTGR